MHLLSSYEVIIDKVRDLYEVDLTSFEVGLEVIQQYLNEHGHEGKIIYLLPQKFITSRHLVLPMNNRKKAELMIPFQLDENLPLPITDLHYASLIQKMGEKHHALVNVIQKDFFAPLHQIMQEKHIMPTLLTSEQFIIQNYVREQGANGSFCILDIGHQTSKAYFIKNKQMISCHISYTAGHVLDEVIASTYSIPFDEAIIYKHENCFLLTSDQLEEVDQDQADFAMLMDKSLSPLIHDLKKWELGFRVKQGDPIQKILLCGGSSNISNIENFITKHLATPCEFMPSISIDGKKAQHSRSEMIVNMIALSQKGKNSPPNLLHGEFSSGYTKNLSLHSSAFILSRTLVLSIMVIFCLIVERNFFIEPHKKKINKRISKLVKKPELKLTPKDQRKYKKKPKRLLSILKKKNLVIEQKIKTISSASQKNAVLPLVTLGQYLNQNKKIDLISFESRDGNCHVTFSSDSKDDLKKLLAHLKSSPFKEMKVNIKNTLLTFNFKE